ncbi:hypothetical protein DID80_07585 [Candidatus Marinamargulisbacteria bacterium SCGC AAA071-K20]|nr:hypothetical protein DID80_07585 [Candidatus Marinamargulisbacteria bacterium SCGC AAA071-K20]
MRTPNRGIQKGLFPEDITVSNLRYLYKSGQVTPSQVALFLYENTEKSDPAIWISKVPKKEVLRNARVLDRIQGDFLSCKRQTLPKLFGIPFVLKDNIDVQGMPSSAGTPALLELVSENNSPVVQQILDSGAILFGKTNMDELAMGITSNNRRFGAVKNPHNPMMFPGGSSGGTAAAVSSNLVPFGLGTDTSGSCLIPAALCGCIGFRPSMNRYSQEGVVPLCHTKDTIGILAKNMEEVTLLDSICATNETETLKIFSDHSQIRIGIPARFFYDDLDPELKEVVQNTLEKLKVAGVKLIMVNLPKNFNKLSSKVTSGVVGGETLLDLKNYLKEHHSHLSIKDVISQMVGRRQGYLLTQLENEGKSDSKYIKALNTHRPALQGVFADYFEQDGIHKIHTILVPTTPLPARPISEGEEVLFNGKYVSEYIYIRNTSPISNAGLPAISLPVGFTREGLPVGMTFVGPEGLDSKLLEICKMLEPII